MAGLGVVRHSVDTNPDWGVWLWCQMGGRGIKSGAMKIPSSCSKLWSLSPENSLTLESCTSPTQAQKRPRPWRHTGWGSLPLPVPSGSQLEAPSPSGSSSRAHQPLSLPPLILLGKPGLAGLSSTFGSPTIQFSSHPSIDPSIYPSVFSLDLWKPGHRPFQKAWDAAFTRAFQPLASSLQPCLVRRLRSWRVGSTPAPWVFREEEGEDRGRWW